MSVNKYERTSAKDTNHGATSEKDKYLGIVS